jgi:hypothetical protein
MFGRKKKLEKAVYKPPSANKIALRKKEILKLIRHRHLSQNELALIEPLRGVLSHCEKQKGVQRAYLMLRSRFDKRKVHQAYKNLYKEFHINALAKKLATRKARIYRQIASLQKDLKRYKKSEAAGEKSRIELMEHLVRHLQRLYPQLTSIRDKMYEILQLAQLWELAEAEGLDDRYSLDASTYAYDPEDTEANVAYLRYLKQRLVERDVKMVDSAVEALVEQGPGVLSVIGEVQNLHQEAKNSIAKTEKALTGRSLCAMDRIHAAELVANLKTQAEKFASLSKSAQQAATLLAGEMKSFNPFIETVGSLSKELTSTKKAFQKGKKQEQYFDKLLSKLNDKAKRLNQAATASTRLWILSRLLEDEHEMLFMDWVQGNVAPVTQAFEVDSYFRDFTAVVTGGGSSFPKDGVQVMLKDYPYQVRSLGEDMRKVYRSVHESNILFLKQVSGASGKANPDYIDAFENYLEARAKTIKRYVNETIQSVLRDQLPDNNEDENNMWVTVLERFVVDELKRNNDSRKPT